MEILFRLRTGEIGLNRFLSWIPIFFCFTLLSFDTSNKGYQVECMSLSDGYLNLKIWNSDKKNEYRLDQARKDAVHAILFSGVSANNDCPNQPPLLSKSEFQERFCSIEKEFFATKGKWSAFTRSSETDSLVPKAGDKKGWKIYVVNVSRNELRKYLEEMKIIPSLTNGF